LRTNPAHDRGAAVVEFALILTLLISLLAGIFEFGRAFWYYDALTKATRDGARLMSVSDKATIASAGVQAAKDAVVFALADPDRGAGVPGVTTDNVDVVCLSAAFDPGPACADGTAPGGVRVQINYPIAIGQFIPFLIGATSSYSATLAPHTTMRYMPADAP
jgi:Flp pilus assembly protein TadG